jgi:hypothetical protein
MSRLSSHVWRRAGARLERQKAVVVLVVVIALTSSGTAAAAVVGDQLKLGVVNSINALTSWTGAVADRLLLIQNTSTAAGARALQLYSRGPWGTAFVLNAGTGPALQLQVGAGSAPITVNTDAGKATNLNADKLDGQDATAFLPSAGKATDADRLDGIDSSAFARGPGQIVHGALAIGAGSDGWKEVLETTQPYFTIAYTCPADLNATGILVLMNDSPELVNVFIDNGGTNPVYLQLTATGGHGDQPAAAAGEHFTVQVQGSYVGTFEIFSAHRPASNDCHVQVQAVLTRR